MTVCRGRLLVVDDAPDTVEVLERNLAAAGYTVLTAANVRQALTILEGTAVDVVITDLKMPGGSGMDLVRHVRDNCRETVVLMITGYPSIDGAVEAVKSGAEDFLPKPFTDDELDRAVQAAFAKLRRHRAMDVEPHAGGSPALVGSSPAMHRLRRLLDRVAGMDSPVLLLGESGVGRQTVARALHYGGRRAAHSFVFTSVAAMAAEHQESEIFGRSDAAATGGGLLGAARGGSLVLGEVAALTLEAQAHLATLLAPPETRLLATSCRDLQALVERGLFRKDLFYRLSVSTLSVPPLRERGDDILELAGWFARRVASEAGRPMPQFSDRAALALRSYSWPGNVRELESVVERLVLTAETPTIDAVDLPALMRFSALRQSSTPRTLAEVEAEHIAAVLAQVGGNRSRAAEILGIDRKTLREKVRRAAPPQDDDE
jgi:two-component system, NtrC family, response regulator HydG